MELEYSGRFGRDLRRLRNRNLLKKVQRKIEELKAESSLWDVTGVEKLRSGRNHYRIRIGEYRLGLELKPSKLKLARFLHRRDIYRYFP